MITIRKATGILFDDDARIAKLTLTKVWARPGDEGARISVVEAI